MPPCPGIMMPESFTPASRLNMDSTRSPTMEIAPIIIPINTAGYKVSKGIIDALKRSAAIIPPISEPAAPATVLLGLTSI